jgi:hypothetical protein
MADILEQKKIKAGKVTYNPALNKYNHNDDPIAQKKLARAKENIAKYGLPEDVANEAAESGVQYNFWTSGIVIHADAKLNTFSLTVQATVKEKPVEYTYIVSTTAEILSSIVKTHWGENVKVFLRPKAIIGQPFYYDLLKFE